MKLRQLIQEACHTPIKWQNGKCIEWDSMDNDDQIENLVALIQRIKDEAYKQGYEDGQKSK